MTLLKYDAHLGIIEGLDENASLRAEAREANDNANALAEETKRLRELIAHGSDRVLRCVYCSEAYPPGTPATGADVAALTAHIATCERHPMASAVAAERQACAELAHRSRFNDGPRGTIEGQISAAILARGGGAHPAVADHGADALDRATRAEQQRDELAAACELAESAITDWTLGSDPGSTEPDMVQMTAASDYLDSVRTTLRAALSKARQ